MSRLPHLVAFVVLALPLATSAFAASPSMPNTTAGGTPVPRTGTTSSAPFTRNTFTAGPMLPVNPDLTGRLPFSATRDALTANPAALPPPRPLPTMSVSPGRVTTPTMSVGPGIVTTPTMSVSPGRVTTPTASVGSGRLTTPPTIVLPSGAQFPRSSIERFAQPGTIDVREDLELFFGGH